MIRHLQSCHFLLIFILCATEFQGAHLPRSYVILGAFLKHNNTYLQDNEIIWPAVQKSLATPALDGLLFLVRIVRLKGKRNRGQKLQKNKQNRNGVNQTSIELTPAYRNKSIDERLPSIYLLIGGVGDQQTGGQYGQTQPVQPHLKKRKKRKRKQEMLHQQSSWKSKSCSKLVTRRES